MLLMNHGGSVILLYPLLYVSVFLRCVKKRNDSMNEKTENYY